MANVITAGNSSNGGTAITTDTSGTLNIVTGSGSGATAVTVDGSGNMVVTGTLTASGGVSGGIRSGTAVTASGTSVDFTSLPTGLKRITVILSGVSTSGTSDVIIQIGAGSVEATSYAGLTNRQTAGGNNISSFTTSFNIDSGVGDATAIRRGFFTIDLVASNTWVLTGNMSNIGAGNTLCMVAGNKTTSGTLDRVRITTVNGTDTFDAGTINILFE